jgi:DNA-directed RNA polymerase specialized sigma24 family protein
MADQHRYPPAHGDEAELFRAFNDKLMRTVGVAVGWGNPQGVEDACAFAWAKFLQCQPDRAKNWRGWLVTTAKREAWQQAGRVREFSHLDEEELEYAAAQSRAFEHDPYQTHLDVEDAFAVLDHLPERLRRIALLRALGMRQKDIGELTGDSPTRVGQLITRANAHIYEVLEERSRESEDLPPRARRLTELEQRPPRWLVERIGRPPRAVRRNVNLSETRRAWRRAALALDDLRQVAGPDFDTSGRPVEPELADLQARAARAIEELDRERARTSRRGIGR